MFVEEFGCRTFYFFFKVSLGVLAFWVAEFGGQDRLAPAK
jgi:hypothetical protein